MILKSYGRVVLTSCCLTTLASKIVSFAVTVCGCGCDLCMCKRRFMRILQRMLLLLLFERKGRREEGRIGALYIPKGVWWASSRLSCFVHETNSLILSMLGTCICFSQLTSGFCLARAVSARSIVLQRFTAYFFSSRTQPAPT